MAFMIPQDVEEFKTDGEKQFYKFLESAAKPDVGYLAWYSPDIDDREPDHKNQRAEPQSPRTTEGQKVRKLEDRGVY